MRKGLKPEEVDWPALDAKPNPAPDEDYVVHIEHPEFNCVCPMTGLPDFGTIHLWYRPKDSIVELKSYKMWMVEFRDVGAFHEQVTKLVLSKVCLALNPVWARVEFHPAPRGGIKTVVGMERGDVHTPEVHSIRHRIGLE